MAGVIIEELDSDEEYGSPRTGEEDEEHQELAEEEFGTPRAVVNDRVADYSTNSARQEGEEPPGTSLPPVPESSTNGHAASAPDLVQPSGPAGTSLAAEGPSSQASRELTTGEQENLDRAEQLKLAGNELYGKGQHLEALEQYQAALEAAPEQAAQQRAVYFANSAAARLKLEEFAAAASDCSAALALEPAAGLQIKALTRRSQAYEKLDELDRALADYEKVVELDPGNGSARAAVHRLKPIVQQRQEKMKDEMIDKLKELGNTVLGKFGMSLDNFKAEKDPQTGSYSINFKQ